MSPRLLALLATFACSREGGFVVGSGVHGVRPAALGPIDVAAVAGAGAALTEDAADGRVKVISDGRVRCYGGALSARAACVRTRGGSLADEVRRSSGVCDPCALPFHRIVSAFHSPLQG